MQEMLNSKDPGLNIRMKMLKIWNSMKKKRKESKKLKKKEKKKLYKKKKHKKNKKL